MQFERNETISLSIVKLPSIRSRGYDASWMTVINHIESVSYLEDSCLKYDSSLVLHNFKQNYLNRLNLLQC